MDTKSLLTRITFNPEVLCGKATIRGNRISVDQVLKYLASGASTGQLLEEYPELEQADIQAVLLYASQLVAEEHVYMLKAA